MAATSASGQAPWKPSHHPALIAISVMMATFMEVLDTSVANVSLPHIAGNLSATSDEATWVLTSYLVSNAVILPMTGWLGARFGRQRFLTTCIVLFTIASALCGAANSLGMLILARVLQGAAGGALQPMSQAILLESFPPEKRGNAMAIFAMGVVVAPIVGPTLGGWITDSYSWRWIFYINVPIGILAAWMTTLFVEDPPYLKRVAGGVDYIGFGFLVIWLASLQFVLDRGQELDWTGSRTIVWCFLISGCSFIAFIVRELTAEAPLVDLSIFLNRNFAVGTGLITLLGALLYGTTAVLPLFLQNLLGYTAMEAGMALSPRGIGAFVTTIIVGRLIGVVSNRALIATGFVILAWSVIALGGINLEVGMKQVIVPTIVSGVAISMIFIPLTTTTMSGLRKEQIGAASGFYNLMRNLGGSFGISAIQTMITRKSQEVQAVMVGHLSPLNPIYERSMAAFQSSFANHGGGSVLAAHRAQEFAYNILQQQASAIAYVNNFTLLGIVCLVSAPLVFLFRKADKPAGPVAVH